MTRIIWFASNHGDIGGGEVMLMAMARAARELGHDVRIVAPATPTSVVDRARSEGFATVAITTDSTAQYLLTLRRWDARERTGLLWCNGLRPALATAGHRDRVVHLHQIPSGTSAVAARLAGLGARRVIAPSHTMSARYRATTMENWTAPLPEVTRQPSGPPWTVGFLGRVTREKGVLVLLDALRLLDGRHPGQFRLLVAGNQTFVSAEDRARVDAALDDLGHLVTRQGWMDRSTFFNAVDVSVFPSVAEESFGLVVSEAMSARAPFVSSDAGALPEVAGVDYPYLARAGDPAALADAIERIVVADHDDLTARLQRRWRETYSPDAGKARLSTILAALDEESS